LTKSKYVSGLQCHRRLWLQVHEPDAPELVPDAAQQVIFDRGTYVGEVARGYVPGGVLIDAPHTRPGERVAQTQRALAEGAQVIYEASFLADGIFVACDILVRHPGGITLTEVKSSTTVKPEHLPDVAVQAHVLCAVGLELDRAEVMHLNRACTYPDLSDLFTRENVTDAMARQLAEVPAESRRQLAIVPRASS